MKSGVPGRSNARRSCSSSGGTSSAPRGSRIAAPAFGEGLDPFRDVPSTPAALARAHHLRRREREIPGRGSSTSPCARKRFDAQVDVSRRGRKRRWRAWRQRLSIRRSDGVEVESSCHRPRRKRSWARALPRASQRCLQSLRPAPIVLSSCQRGLEWSEAPRATVANFRELLANVDNWRSPAEMVCPADSSSSVPCPTSVDLRTPRPRRQVSRRPKLCPPCLEHWSPKQRPSCRSDRHAQSNQGVSGPDTRAVRHTVVCTASSESATSSVRLSSFTFTSDQITLPSLSIRNVPRSGAPVVSLNTP